MRRMDNLSCQASEQDRAGQMYGGKRGSSAAASERDGPTPKQALLQSADESDTSLGGQDGLETRDELASTLGIAWEYCAAGLEAEALL